jgi:hypothetical protein
MSMDSVDASNGKYNSSSIWTYPLLLPSHAVNLMSYKPEYHMDLGDVTFGSLQAQNFVKKLLLWKQSWIL